MELQLIRNATMRLAYAGQTLLTDPFFAPRHAIRSFGGREENPIVDLPLSVEEIVAGVALVLVSHLHPDHWDAAAAAALPKDLPLLCRPGDEARLAADGFSDVRPLFARLAWQGIELQRTQGQHGTGALAERMGGVCGFLLRAPGEPTVYWCGDTIWYRPVAETLRRESPDIVITHSAGARFGDSEPIIMDAAQTIALCQAAPSATVVAVHLESLDHGTVSRAALRAAAEAAAIPAARLRIPVDGELLQFET